MYSEMGRRIVASAAVRHDRLDSGIVAEDLLRAGIYRLLAHAFSAPPSASNLKTWATLEASDNSFGRAIAVLSAAARATDVTTARQDFQDLFIGLGRGEFVPYGSYYLTGFLQEKPLARLRQDMERLSIARSGGISDPEDHIAAVLDMMAGLIDGAFGAPLTPGQQKSFFNAHLGSWAPVFFRDLEASATSRLYSALGAVGRQFMIIEDRAFAMV
jgi:TorA maturation chaperone TorD